MKLSDSYDKDSIDPIYMAAPNNRPTEGRVNEAFEPSVASEPTQRSADVNSSAASTSDSTTSPKRSEGAYDQNGKPIPIPRRSTGDGGSNSAATIETDPV